MDTYEKNKNLAPCCKMMMISGLKNPDEFDCLKIKGRWRSFIFREYNAYELAVPLIREQYIVRLGEEFLLAHGNGIVAVTYPRYSPQEKFKEFELATSDLLSYFQGFEKCTRLKAEISLWHRGEDWLDENLVKREEKFLEQLIGKELY